MYLRQAIRASLSFNQPSSTNSIRLSSNLILLPLFLLFLCLRTLALSSSLLLPGHSLCRIILRKQHLTKQHTLLSFYFLLQFFNITYYNKLITKLSNDISTLVIKGTHPNSGGP